MTQPHRCGNQVGKQSETCVGLEKIFAGRKQSRIEHLFDAGQVNLSILGEGMVPMNQQCSKGQEHKGD